MIAPWHCAERKQKKMGQDNQSQTRSPDSDIPKLCQSEQDQLTFPNPKNEAGDTTWSWLTELLEELNKIYNKTLAKW